jgi:hypothetical protein
MVTKIRVMTGLTFMGLLLSAYVEGCDIHEIRGHVTSSSLSEGTVAVLLM